jgi:hypothetical protein
MPDVEYFRGAGFDIGNCLVATEIRDRLSVSKLETHKFDIQRFNLKLNIVKVREKYQVEISTTLAALENL